LFAVLSALFEFLSDRFKKINGLSEFINDMFTVLNGSFEFLSDRFKKINGLFEFINGKIQK
jgi:hypothetical protein